MLYNGNNPILRVVGVEHLQWSSGSFEVNPRTYSALSFRIKGNASIICQSGKYAIGTNDILYLPQNMAYTAKYTDTEMIVIHFITQYDDDQIEVFNFQNEEEIYKSFLRTHLFWRNKEPGYSAYVMSQLYKILGMITEKQTKQSLPPHFLNAVSFINSNYRNRTIDIASICAHAGIGPTALRLFFRNYYNKTPVEYITDLRLEYARNLISGGMAIEKAAFESGFNDAKYFARVVRKYFDCSPRELKSYCK